MGNEMTNLEINKALALAIGWKRDALYINYYGALQIDISNATERYPMRVLFDYRDWNVIGPIAERYEAFPLISDSKPGIWFTRVRNQNRLQVPFAYADTPQKAIALAVINGANK